jgi:hypothetical protein
MADCYSGNMSVVLAPGSKMTRMAYWAHCGSLGLADAGEM